LFPVLIDQLNTHWPMKVKLLLRNPQDYLRETADDIHKLARNPAPELHPMSAETEYVRALNAAKLERVFAKPFLGCFGDQGDQLSRVCMHPRALSLCLSGCVDGRVAFWNIPRRSRVLQLDAHSGCVQGLCWHPEQDLFYSCCDTDRTLKAWRVGDDLVEFSRPVSQRHLDFAPLNLDHHVSKDLFALSGDAVYLYDSRRSDPVGQWKWGSDSVLQARFNPTEWHLLAAVTKDNALLLIDTRQREPLRRIRCEFRQNALCWNPQEPFVLATASDDYNLYSWDARRLASPACVYRGHTNAAMDVDFAPTGRELVSASYDCTVRLWESGRSQSRDVYHTKRMYRVFAARYSLDARFIVTASADFNLRLWKARASEKLGALTPRERAAVNTAEALKQKYAHHPQVRRIVQHRHLPKRLYQAQLEMKAIRGKQRRKEVNRREHRGEDKEPFVPERDRHVRGVDE
ncbi:hypothetical protein BOX15_Mlig016022g1, partial [Macrostomum lignano]